MNIIRRFEEPTTLIIMGNHSESKVYIEITDDYSGLNVKSDNVVDLECDGFVSIFKIPEFEEYLKEYECPFTSDDYDMSEEELFIIVNNFVGEITCFVTCESENKLPLDQRTKHTDFNPSSYIHHQNIPGVEQDGGMNYADVYLDLGKGHTLEVLSYEQLQEKLKVNALDESTS